MRVSRIFVLVALLAASWAPAQDLVVLADGTRAEGVLRTKGRLTWLVSPVGSRAITADAVVGEEALAPLLEQYQEQLQGLPQGFVAGHMALASWCADRGYLTGALEQLEIVLQAEPRNARAHAVAATLAAAWQLDPRETAERPRDQRAFVRRLLDEIPARGFGPAAVAAAKAATLPAEDHLFRTALSALKHPQPSVRWMAARTLTRFRDEPQRIKPLYRMGLYDASAPVRDAATEALAVTQDEAFVRLFARGIDHPHTGIRVHAIEALGALGQKAAVPHLIAALADGGGPVRNNIAVTTQRAYLKDFDVEVAQGAVIADPIVDVVQDGAILDVAVVHVSIVRTRAAASLARLTGQRLGTDFAAWRRYWDGQTGR